MPNLAAKFSSDYLTADHMAEALKALPAALIELFGDCKCTVLYGWGTQLHIDLWYKPMSVGTCGMSWFIEESLDQRIFVPGGSDLLINSPGNELAILFCHESDIHVDGESPDAMRRFMAADTFRNMRFYSQAELKLQYPELDPSRVSD
ncbi:MAG TPA: hypothetical protein VFI31_27340 [Pirellulales bacterium]|nr:hypothetical protein [Pirellulales bacterium]